jgi:hypothetical protein
MSGGGGGDSSRDWDKLRAEALRDITTDQFDAEINRLLMDQLADFNSRDTDRTNEQLQDVKQALDEVVEGTVDLLFGGSVAKHTYVDGLSDVDALVVLDEGRIGGATPAELIAAFAEALQLTHENIGARVSVGRLAVTIDYRDGSKLQLLPAVRRQNLLAIANRDGTAWATIRPERFAAKLTETNAAQNHRVVPVIKLAKRLIADLPESRRVSGYHMESLAIEAFKNYAGPKTVKAMLTHLMEAASTRVLTPIRDRSGQSLHVDDDLGKANSVERRLVADSLGRLARRMQYATSLSQWEAMFRS